MSEPKITTDEAAECLRVLQVARGPIVAADLAARLYLSGSRETRRRHVRKIIEYLREAGNWIIANNREGCKLTTDPKKWRDYQEQRQIEAKRTFGITHKRKKIMSEGTGQGVLFDNRIQCGVATCGP